MTQHPTNPGPDAPAAPDFAGAIEALLHELRDDPDAPRDERWLARFCRSRNRGVSDVRLHIRKRGLLPFYLRIREHDPALWHRWGVTPGLEAALMALLRTKPRRTGSGVATITVISKPWPCSGACRFCPSDLRMPKSYLPDEPACQRAEQSWFDPYLQASGRLEVLSQMGHPTDKVELIVLGGTWTEYPPSYQRWFVSELFRALNDGVGEKARRQRAERARAYERAGLPRDAAGCAERTSLTQGPVDAGNQTYNQALPGLYGPQTAWGALAALQTCDAPQLAELQRQNETAACRCVGLSVETRPDAVTAARLTLLRELGCTKVQVGIQSTSAELLALNGRPVDPAVTAEALELLRLFGFKVHGHFMVNLLGATPESDKSDYLRFVQDPRFRPDEVKLYPCALIAGTALVRDHAAGRWRPYALDELLDVLEADVLATPRWVRVSRMVRDFSAGDIVAGNKQANLRQCVEGDLRAGGRPVREIRFREVALGPGPGGRLEQRTTRYDARGSEERFLEWVAPGDTLHGFLRLSLPEPGAVTSREGLPIGPGEAMIREVHVYGRVSRLRETDAGSQHRGLGRSLVEEACRQAREAGYRAVNVISAVGTREYYRGLGFRDAGLYLQRPL